MRIWAAKRRRSAQSQTRANIANQEPPSMTVATRDGQMAWRRAYTRARWPAAARLMSHAAPDDVTNPTGR